MKSSGITNFANIALSILAAGLAGAIWYSHSRAIRVRELVTQIDSANLQILAAQKELGETFAVGQDSEMTPRSISGQIRQQTPEELRHFRIVESKEARQLRDADRRIKAYITWAPLLSRLRLSQREELRLIDLLYDKDNVGEYINAAFLSPDKKLGTIDPSAVRGARQQVEQSIASEIRTLLGDDRLPTLENFQMNLRSVLAASELQQACAVLGEPLSMAQYEQLCAKIENSLATPIGANSIVAVGNSIDQYIGGSGRSNYHELSPNAFFINDKGSISVNIPAAIISSSSAHLALSPAQEKAIEIIIKKKSAESQLADFLYR